MFFASFSMTKLATRSIRVNSIMLTATITTQYKMMQKTWENDGNPGI